MQLRFRQGIVTLCIVVLQAYAVAAFYLLPRIGLDRSPIKFLSVFSSIPENARFALESIEYFPWTDMGENVLHAFYIAHGMKFGVDAVVAHLPGVPLYLAAFMWSLGFWSAVPSAQTAFAAYSLSAVAVAFFQVGCVVASFSLFSATRLGLLVAPLFVFLAADSFDMIMPMSENLIAYWLIFMFAMLCRMMVFDEPPDQITKAILIGGPINLVCLLLGATIFPSNIFIGLFCLGYLVFHLAHNGSRIRKPFRAAMLVAAACCALIAVTVLLTTDIPGVIFWNIDVNRYLGFNVAHYLVWAPFVHLTAIATQALPLGANIFHLVGAAILFSISYANWVRPRRWRSVVAFVLMTLIFALLSQWRSYDSYKAAMPFGISWALVIAALGIASSKIRNHLPSIENSRWFVASLIIVYGVLTLSSPWLTGAIVSYSTEHAPRPAAYEQARVCRFGERENCRCLQSTIFGPQQFLHVDVMPCRNRYASWNTLLARVKTTKEWMVSDSRDPNVVFEVYSSERMRGEKVPDEAIAYWETEAACTELVHGLNRLCFAR